jgi:hypothetical protein
MKKSEIYHQAQVSVLTDIGSLSCEARLEILRELMEQEDLALFNESREKENADATV